MPAFARKSALPYVVLFVSQPGATSATHFPHLCLFLNGQDKASIGDRLETRPASLNERQCAFTKIEREIAG
jgi:hypothetical protein